MGIFPNFRGENTKYLKPPPRMSYIHRDDIIHHLNKVRTRFQASGGTEAYFRIFWVGGFSLT